MNNAKIVLIGLVVALALGLVGVLSYVKQGSVASALDKSQGELARQIDGLQKRVGPLVYAGEPVGYMITFENGAKFYFAGDTGFTSDMKELIGDYYQPDVAFLPIGGMYTMGPELAAYAASKIRPSTYIVPAHYNSYPMLTKSADVFVAELEKYNIGSASPLVFKEGEMKEVMGIKVLWLGHASWYFESPDGNQILIDPEIANNLSYPEKYKNVKANFTDIDLILTTHGHLDHATIPDYQMWTEAFKPILIAPFELGMWMQDYIKTPIVTINKGANINKEKIQQFGIEVPELDGIIIDVVPADHSSGAFPMQ